MDYLPPGRVVKVCDPRWHRYIIRDGLGQYWAGKRWSDKSAEAVLFHTEINAIEERNRCCLGDDTGDTFMATIVVTIVVTVHAGCWSVEELAAHLKRHRKFCVGGPAGKAGLLLEILADTLKKIER